MAQIRRKRVSAVGGLPQEADRVEPHLQDYDAPLSWPFLSRWWVMYSCIVAGAGLGIALPVALLREPWGPAAFAVLTLQAAGFLVWALVRGLKQK